MVSSPFEASIARRSGSFLRSRGAAFAVAPIAYPHQALARALFRRRPEATRICCLVPDEHTIVPAPAAINVGESLTESEHAIISTEVIGAHLVRRGNGAVVRVVEQQGE